MYVCRCWHSQRVVGFLLLNNSNIFRYRTLNGYAVERISGLVTGCIRDWYQCERSGCWRGTVAIQLVRPALEGSIVAGQNVQDKAQ